MHKGSLDKRERKFAAGVAAGKSLRQAAREAGYAPSTAEKKAYKIVRSPRVQSFLTDAMERLGVTAEMIVQPIKNALLAKRTVAIKRKRARCSPRPMSPTSGCSWRGLIAPNACTG